MVNKAATKVAFLPTLSPKCPKKTAPIGLERNPVPKIINTDIICVNESNFGKKDCPISLAKMAKSVKPKYSIKFPNNEVKAILLLVCILQIPNSVKLGILVYINLFFATDIMNQNYS